MKFSQNTKTNHSYPFGFLLAHLQVSLQASSILSFERQFKIWLDLSVIAKIVSASPSRLCFTKVLILTPDTFSKVEISYKTLVPLPVPRLYELNP